MRCDARCDAAMPIDADAMLRDADAAMPAAADAKSRSRRRHTRRRT
jgi:hypothetical protein